MRFCQTFWNRPPVLVLKGLQFLSSDAPFMAFSTERHGRATWTLAKLLDKNLDRNYTRVLHVVLNKSWKQHHTEQQLYGHSPPISQIIQDEQDMLAHCWKSKDELISNFLLWNPTHRSTRVARPKSNAYICQHCENTRCRLEDLPRVTEEKERERERERDTVGTSCWWWWWWWWKRYIINECSHNVILWQT